MIEDGKNPYIKNNSFYLVDGEDELTEYACPSLPENRTRGLETERKSKLFEQLKAYDEIQNKNNNVVVRSNQLVKKLNNRY